MSVDTNRVVDSENSTNAILTTTTVKPDASSDVTPLIGDTNGGGGLSGGAIAGIVIGILVFILLLIAAFFLVRYFRDRRKNHGEYRPQFEEQHHAKNLPYLQPVAVEGLI